MGIGGYDCEACHGLRCARFANTDPYSPQDDSTPERDRCDASCKGGQFCFERKSVFVPKRLLSAAPDATSPLELAPFYDCIFDGYDHFPLLPPQGQGAAAAAAGAAAAAAAGASPAVRFLASERMPGVTADDAERMRIKKPGHTYLVVGDVYCASCWHKTVPAVDVTVLNSFVIDPVVPSLKELAKAAAWQLKWQLGVLKEYELKNGVPNLAEAAARAALLPGGTAAAERSRVLNLRWIHLLDAMERSWQFAIETQSTRAAENQEEAIPRLTRGDDLNARFMHLLGTMGTTSSASIEVKSARAAQCEEAISVLTQLTSDEPGVRVVWGFTMVSWLQNRLNEKHTADVALFQTILWVLNHPTTVVLNRDAGACELLAINEERRASLRDELLHAAASGGRPLAVAMLLQDGASPLASTDSRGMVAPLAAVRRVDNPFDHCAQRRLAVVQHFVAAGIDPIAPLQLTRAHDGDDAT